ncbi:MAG: MBL fold metallo-hydrolase [Candidatus Sungbacteria bacterium]|nr:MBL fold metallo-hydrolase [Candidatus Sungbacteria bacterium]
MFIKFISHAGIFLEEGAFSLLIDPWFTDSTLVSPLMHSLSGHTTIDFQIPQAKDAINSFSPNAILLSHFHAHHGPRADLVAFAARQNPLLIAHPDAGGVNQTAKAHFSVYPKVALMPLADQGTLRVGPFFITALSHTVPLHVAWHVVTKTGSILHIADARANAKISQNSLDPLWNAFVELKPNIVFISASGNSSRVQKEGVREIREAATMSAIGGARILQLLKPQAASLIGCYNHSIWKNRSEYILPTSAAEEQFYWAASWLAPETKCIFAKPGHTYGIGDGSLAGEVDTFVSGPTFREKLKEIWNRT